jgi:FKBP-type peptidyl-prolyl cis-trans isomerase FkpA
MKKIVFLLAMIVSFVSCDETQKQLEKDIEIIENYLKNNDIEAESTGSGLFYVIKRQGSGEAPSEYSWVKVRYEGRLLDNGVLFDKGTTENYLVNYIKGWREGIQLFNEGGEGTLYVPSKLGYGDEQQGSIPPNSVLIFEIELLEVTPSQFDN